MTDHGFKEGDRVRVIDLMRDDPLPPTIGATGTVVALYSDGGIDKMQVTWDQGFPPAVNTLLLPHDRHVFTKEGTDDS